MNRIHLHPSIFFHIMGKPVILCVDDEVVVLDSLKIQLKNAFEDAYLYEMAENTTEAFEIIEDLGEEEIPLIVIVSDWLMPGIKGDEFLIKIHQKHPKVIKIMLTGQADQDSLKRAIEHADLHRVLYKPWRESELIETINTGLQKIESYD